MTLINILRSRHAYTRNIYPMVLDLCTRVIRAITINKRSSNMALSLRLFTRRNCRFYSTHDIQEYFQYSRAIVGSLNDNFINGSIKIEVPEETINLSKAKRDHEEYVDNLGKLLTNKITHIPENDLYPDQVFVEDPAVVYGGIALLTNMKMPSRHGERGPMKHALESLGLPVHEMNNPNAYLDGGDVLFTGREFFIGLSSRTNKVILVRLI